MNTTTNTTMKTTMKTASASTDTPWLDDLDHDDELEGLAVDLPLLSRLAVPLPRFGRRRLLGYAVGGVGAAAVLAACGSSGSSSSGSAGSAAATNAPTTAGSDAPTTAGSAGTATADATTTAATSTTAASGSTAGTTGTATVASAGNVIPNETAGPFPGDGTNGPNALTASGVVRNDIRSSFGSSTTTAGGIETLHQLTIVEAETGEPIPGAAVYLWHCDQNGRYSLYDLPGENYLRGVQVADENGYLAFTSIFPGCYAGRWPHAHFEIYSSIDEATVGSQAVKTSQLAYPEASCDEAYATSGYESSVANLTRSSLSSDNIFRDGVEDQMVTMTGDPSGGYTASLLIRI